MIFGARLTWDLMYQISQMHEGQRPKILIANFEDTVNEGHVNDPFSSAGIKKAEDRPVSQ
jgi:hypothetical protein